MALFEIFIPTTDPAGFNITARVRADSWIQALRNGLSRLGDNTDVRNVLCDITEDAIDVTEPASGRVFRIREVAEAAPPQVVPSAPPPVVVARVVPPPPVTAGPPPPAKARAVTPPAAADRPATRFAGTYEEESVVREKAGAGPGVPIGRAHVEESSIDDLIAKLFESAQGVYERPDLTAAAYFLLDLAMQAIPSDSGAVFIADINREDLYFAAARGPKGQEVMKFRVPMGQGIVGFAAQVGVSLAVSDVQRDPRFYARIAKSLGYETRSILCAPAQKEGRVLGALELINKKSGTSYTREEVSLANYLAHELAEYLVSTGQAGA